MDKKIKKILKDLYKIDPKLKSKQKEIISFIEFLLDSKPEVELDKKFIFELHEKIKQEIKLSNFNTQKLSFENKNYYLKNAAFFSLGLAACFAFILTTMYFYNQNKAVSLDLGGIKISQVESNNFGVLNFKNESLSGEAMVDGRGAGAGEIYATVEPNSAGVMTKSLIYNPIKYNYNYIGENFELEGDEAYVYKYKNISDSSKEMAKVFKNIDLGLIDINKFSDLGLRYLSLAEDRDFGYSINLDFIGGTVNIGENYEKWQNDPKPNCVGDEECLSKIMLKPEDMLSENEIIKIADNFLSKYNIDKNNYAAPIIQDNWKTYFERDEEMKKYVPEIVQVIFPLLVDGKKVYDERAYPVGLNVNVSIRYKRVSGVYNLRVENYESSLYKINTNTEDVLEKVNTVGYNSYLPEGSEIKNLDIDSPELILVQVHNYKGSESEELLVPGLIFEVKNKPEDYSGQNKVVVLLVEDVVDERDEPVYRVL